MGTISKGITYGSFDTLHFGHIRLLKRIKDRVDYLIVGLSIDEFNKIKGKKCYQTFKERKKYLEAIKYVDEIIPETCWEQKKEDIKKVDLFFMGDDWQGKFDHLGCVYLPRTKHVSSTKIRNIITE